MKRIFFIVLTACLLTDCFVDKSETASMPPEANRFTYNVVINGLEEPLQIKFDREEHVYWIERTGAIKRIHEPTGRIDELGVLPLHEGDSPGLIGFLLDNNFEQTRQLYVYYSAADDEGNMRLSRFTLNANGTLAMDSEVVLLKVPWDQPDSSHFGGGMAWDSEGNLYLSVGGDTQYSHYEPIFYFNEQDSSEIYDAARTAGNTNDLRGSILRITPQSDGSYTIPEGNLFDKNTPKIRPEIYVMGNRNPWRLAVDSQNGYLHWATAGPDAGEDSEKYGAMGYDEFNIAKEAGNYGWPFIVGKNRPYFQYDYKTKTYGAPYNIEGPVNNSPNNTGLRKLPPTRPALVAYSYGVTEEWPLLSSGGRSAVGGPVFRRENFPTNAPRVFPKYYEGKWLVTDYVRNWIMVITMNEERTEAMDIERLIPWERLSHNRPLDMDFSPTGDLYLIEYSRGAKGRISKYIYNNGNRPPQAQLNADRTSGTTPLKLQLSSEGSQDYDDDELSYQWEVSLVGSKEVKQFSQANPSVTLEQLGKYDVVLIVSDPEGASDRDSLKIVAGNQRPEVNIQITKGNQSFYFPDDTIDYRLEVRDREDGSLADESIQRDQVHLTAEYIPSGLSASEVTELKKIEQIGDEISLRYLQAQKLIKQQNCSTCHRHEGALVGPSFTKISQKYSSTDKTVSALAKSILEGSEGIWGDTPMPPQVMLSDIEATQVAEYILSLSHQESDQNRFPVQGSYSTKGHKKTNIEEDPDRLDRFFEVHYERGSYVFQAHYTDKGGKVDGLELSGEDLVVLRYPLLAPESADVVSEEGITFTPSVKREPGFIVTGSGSYIGFEQIDLTGVNQINIGSKTRHYQWSHFIGATFEVRLDSPEGPLVGKPFEVKPPDNVTAKIDVSEVSGLHDVYIMFRNPEAESDDALISVSGIGFKQ